jgi:hypothetical protein
LSFSMCVVSRRGRADFVARSSDQRSWRPRLAAMSVSRTVNTTVLPSGDSAGSDTRWTRTRSSTEKGGRSAASAAPASKGTSATHGAISEREETMET